MLKTVNNIDIKNEEYIYNFQLELTSKLDFIDGDFSQDIINEIVLWKVNRYAKLDVNIIDEINKIKKNENELDIIFTKNLLEVLISTKGIKLPMASTILRFKNPSIYQIIDQRVYRFIYGETLSLTGLKTEAIIKLYIDYLEKLKSVCLAKGIKYEDSDRILYALDKKLNKNIKIIY